MLPPAANAMARTAFSASWTRNRGRFRPTFPLFARSCHREGQNAALRYTGTQHDIIHNYRESIHGKGLLKSGLTVTATCTSCHTAHGELPRQGSGIDCQQQEPARHLRQVPSRH